MHNYVIVFLGTGFGGMARYWGSAFVYKYLPSDFPYGTLIVNLLGSFFIGIFMFYLNAYELINIETRIFLTTGLCGGLTTFSTFSFETINFLKEGEYLFAGINIISNVFIALLALFIALKLSNLLAGI